MCSANVLFYCSIKVSQNAPKIRSRVLSKTKVRLKLFNRQCAIMSSAVHRVEWMVTLWQTYIYVVAFVCTWAFEWLMEHRLLIKCLHPSPSVLGHLDPRDAMAVILLHLPFRAANYHQPNADKFWTWPVNLSALPATLAGHRHLSEVLSWSANLNTERFR